MTWASEGRSDESYAAKTNHPSALPGRDMISSAPTTAPYPFYKKHSLLLSEDISSLHTYTRFLLNKPVFLGNGLKSPSKFRMR
jgi:hypothetical protein